RNHMRSNRPPIIATFILERFGCDPMNDAIIGDLAEEYARRSDWWYWRQVLTVIAIGYVREVRARKLQVLKDVLSGWFVMLLVYGSVVGLIISQLQRLEIKPEHATLFIQGTIYRWVFPAWLYWALAAAGWVLKQWNPGKPQFALLSFSITEVFYILLQDWVHWNDYFNGSWFTSLLRVILGTTLMPIFVYF